MFQTVPKRLLIILAVILIMLVGFYGGLKFLEKSQENEIAELREKIEKSNVQLEESLINSPELLSFVKFLAIKKLLQERLKANELLKFLEQNFPSQLRVKALSINFESKEIKFEGQVAGWLDLLSIKKGFRQREIFNKFQISQVKFSPKEGLVFSFTGELNYPKK